MLLRALTKHSTELGHQRCEALVGCSNIDDGAFAGHCVRGRHQNGIDHMDHAIVGLNVGGGDLGKVQKQGVFLG